MDYIFIHGLGQTEKSWDNVISKLERERVHCPNLQRLLNSQDTTYKKLYGSFRKYCNSFSEPLNLCGISLGGILALNYAVEYPDKVKSLILIGTQYKMPKTLLKLQNIIFKFMPKSTFDDMGFNKKQFINLTNSMATLDFSDNLKNITCKTLIICGAKDAANKKAAVRLSEIVKNSRLIYIKNSNHQVNIDNPERLFEEINQFYDGIK